MIPWSRVYGLSIGTGHTGGKMDHFFCVKNLEKLVFLHESGREKSFLRFEEASIFQYGHVYFVLHQRCTIPRKGFEKGICKEGWYDFSWRRPFRGSALEGLCWLSGDVKKTYREG